MLSMHSLSQMMLIILHLVWFGRGNQEKGVYDKCFLPYELVVANNYRFELVETIFISIYISAAAPFREKGNRPFARY